MHHNTKQLFVHLAGLLDARQRCIDTNNEQWRDRHEANALTIVKNFMPSGSGIDNGTKLDLDKSNGEKLVFYFGYHHMNESGYYDGWTEHTLTVRASMVYGIDLKISGKDRNDVKDYLYEVYRHALTQLLHHDEKGFHLEREATV